MKTAARNISVQSVATALSVSPGLRIVRAAQARLSASRDAAYAEITGEDWKPYEAPTPPAATVARQSAAVEMAAFQAA